MSDIGPAATSRKRISRSGLLIGLAVLVAVALGYVALRPTGGHPSADSATAPTPAAVPYVAIPGCYNHTVPPAERPDQLNVVGCASVAVALQKMAWSSWGADAADGTGTAVFTLCDPTCATGYKTNRKAVLHAWNPQTPPADATCPVGLKVFSDLIVAFPEDVPPPSAQPMTTTYNGIPAVHYTNYRTDRADAQFIGTTMCY